MIGPKNRATLAVPRAWTRNRRDQDAGGDRQHAAWPTSCGTPGASRTPSTAESTDIAGVMMPSP